MSDFPLPPALAVQPHSPYPATRRPYSVNDIARVRQAPDPGSLDVGDAGDQCLRLPMAVKRDRDQLEWWAATQTPLLGDSDPSGGVTLHGRSGSVTGLRSDDGTADPDCSISGPWRLTLGHITIDDLILLGRL